MYDVYVKIHREKEVVNDDQQQDSTSDSTQENQSDSSPTAATSTNTESSESPTTSSNQMSTSSYDITIAEKMPRPRLTSVEISDALALVDECIADKNVKRPISREIPAFVVVTPTESSKPTDDDGGPTESPAPPQYPAVEYNNPYQKSAEYALPDRDIRIGSHQARTARIISVADNVTTTNFRHSSIEMDTGGGYSTIEELNGADDVIAEDNLADSGNSLDASDSVGQASGQPGASTSDVDSGIEGSSLTAVPVEDVVLGLPGEESSSVTATSDRIVQYLKEDTTVEVSVHSESSHTPTPTNTMSSTNSEPGLVTNPSPSSLGVSEVSNFYVFPLVYIACLYPLTPHITLLGNSQ